MNEMLFTSFLCQFSVTYEYLNPIVFRKRDDLAEHIAVTVTYLGGSSDSLTLNFSRPASGPYVRKYKHNYRHEYLMSCLTFSFIKSSTSF